MEQQSADKLEEIRLALKANLTDKDKEEIEAYDQLTPKDQLLYNIETLPDDLYDPKLEANIIGIIIHHCEAKDKNNVNGLLSKLHEEDLYLPINKLIYNIIKENVLNDRDSDKTIICRMIKDSIASKRITKDRYMLMGGDNYIFKNVPSTNDIGRTDAYLKALRALNTRRKIDKVKSSLDSGIKSNKFTELEIIKYGKSELEGIEDQLFKEEDSEGKLQPALDTVIEEIDYYSNNKELDPGVYTGFREIDKITGGIKPHEMLLVGARPGIGKTSYLLTILQQKCFNESIPTLLFSLEMGKEQIIDRLLSSYYNIPQWKIRQRKLQDWERETIKQNRDGFLDFPLRIYDNTDIDANQMSLIIRKSVAEHNTKIVIIDYIQLINGQKKYASSHINRQEEISYISRTLKNANLNNDIIIIVASQLNRNIERIENKRPQLSDLRDSGSLEQDADHVHLLYRPKKEVEEPEQEYIENQPLETEVIVAKNRYGVAFKTATLLFEGDYVRFKDNELPNIDAPF